MWVDRLGSISIFKSVAFLLLFIRLRFVWTVAGYQNQNLVEQTLYVKCHRRGRRSVNEGSPRYNVASATA